VEKSTISTSSVDKAGTVFGVCDPAKKEIGTAMVRLSTLFKEATDGESQSKVAPGLSNDYKTSDTISLKSFVPFWWQDKL